MKKPNKHDRVLMICPNSQVERDVNELFKRAAGVLQLVENFADAAVELDTDAPDFREKVGPPLEDFFIGIVRLYPNSAQVKGKHRNFSQFDVCQNQE